LRYLSDHKGSSLLAVVFMLLAAASTGIVMKQLEPITNETFLKSADPQATFTHLLNFVIPVTFAAAAAVLLWHWGRP